MRYINKEYGFEFRPPFYDKFYEEKKDGPALSELRFPNRYIRGAGYDYTAINGAMLIGKSGSMWGIRVSCFVGGKWLDNDDFIYNMNASSANTADGGFAHFASGNLSAKWVTYGEQGMLLQLASRKKMRVRVIFYPCHNLSGELSIEGAHVLGRSPHIGILPGSVALGESSAIFKDRHAVICDTLESREYFMAQSYSKPSDTANGAFNEAIMEFVLGKHQPSVCVYAAVGDEGVKEQAPPSLERALKQIDTAELMYGVNKTMGTGILGAPTERMLNSVLWSRVYYPYLLTDIFAPTRTLLNKHFDIKGMEENCSAMLGGLTGELEKAAYQLGITVEDKILAVLAAWNTYCRQIDKSGMASIFRRLCKMYPADPQLVVSGKNQNEIAYKWHDSPLKEKTNKPMYSLDLSCLKLLAFDILERVSVVYDFGERLEYEVAKKILAKSINDTFWNEEKGLYQNRFVDGAFSSVMGATSFYPLLAGAVDTAEKLSKMVDTLTNPKLFWSGYPVPTLPANNAEFGKKGTPDNNGKQNPPFFEYRGSIVPYVNYIIYMGLARYGVEELAGEIAAKSSKLWASNESDNVENYSMYLPNGKRYKAKEYFSSNGNMLAMIGYLELIDLELFRPDLKTHALRFGTFCEGVHTVSNVKILDKIYSVEVLDDSTVLLINEIPVFRGDGGRFVVRNFLETPSGFEFMLSAKSDLIVSLFSGSYTEALRFKIPKGKSMVVVENGKANITRIS